MSSTPKRVIYVSKKQAGGLFKVIKFTEQADGSFRKATILKDQSKPDAEDAVFRLERGIYQKPKFKKP